MSDTAVTGLSAAKQALLEKLMKERGLSAQQKPVGIPRRDDATWAPLSYAQRSLWFINQLEGATTTYNMGGGLRIDGPFSTEALRMALRVVAARHETLRTVFAKREDGPVQRILDVSTPQETVFPLFEHRVECVDQDTALAQGRALIERHANTPFDLEHGPLIRAVLVDLGGDCRLLYFCMHHIISDAWSMDVLSQEVLAVYSVAREGRAPILPQLTVQYGDYAAWQAGAEYQSALDSQMTYWTQQLDGVPHALELPTDRPRPMRLSVRGGLEALVLDAALTARLHQVARSCGATPFMALLACWQLLLWKLSGQSDFVVGVSSLNRQRKALEPLIGYFINTLAVRCKPHREQRFDAFLAAVRDATTAAYKHQDLPFERVVEALGVARELDRTPLAQARFAYANVQAQSAELPGLRFSPLDLAQRDLNAKCDLLLVMWPDGDRLQGTLQYSADLFDAATARGLAARLRMLVESVCDNPTSALGALRHLPDDERDAIVSWRRTSRAWGAPHSVPAMVHAHVQATPDAPAVACDGRVLSFAALSANVASVAHTLRARSIGPGDRVGVCTGRTPEFVIALLATMAAGAAYVPLDRMQPPARLAMVVEEAALALVLHDADGAAAVGALSIPSLGVADAMDAGHGATWRDDAQPDGAAYLIFTSGSTGKPKGVQVPHRALFNYVQALGEVLPLNAGAEHVALSTLSADLGNTAIFGALCAGGCLRLLSDDASLDALRLADALEVRPVDCLKIVPSHLDMLLRTGDPLRLLPRQCLVFGGEQLPPALVARIRALRPDLAIINHYGPTETTIGVLTHRIGDGNLDTVPLGRPLANVAAYLLNEALQPVGVGETGELYFGGDCVADGYFGAPELTAERFVPDPFATVPGVRMYRTGDLARYGHDGTLRFFGRRDHQVKIRGHRVELSEVEAVMRAQAGVRDCAVITASGASVDDALTAFVVLVEGAGVDALRAALRESLPEHMVPAAIVPMDALPLNANGKIDRARLKVPEASAAQQTPAQDAPLATDPGACALRNQVRTIWYEVLKRDDFADDARFFDIGGHSLTATLVVFRLRKAIAPDLTVRDLFEHPTIAMLADHIGRMAMGEGEGAILPRARPQWVPPTLTQERLWFVDQLASGSSAYNIPLGLRLRGALDKDAMRAALAAVVQRHESLRTVFQSHDGAPRQVIRPHMDVPMAEQSLVDITPAQREVAVQAALQDEVTTPFSLADGPLIRTRLLGLGDDESVLLLTMHHIISDGWSNEIIAREIGTLYAALCTGESAPELPPLPIQYADYALWEREQLDNGGFQHHIDYWKTRLAGAPEVTALPIDRERSAEMSGEGGSEQFTIPADTAAAVKRFCAEEGTTPFVVLQVAFKLLLSKYSGQRDVVVGTTHANRSRPEVEPLVGFFVNQVPLRSGFDPAETVRALVRREIASVTQDFSHHELPLNLLVSSLAQERRLDQAPVFQTLFVLQNVPRHDFTLPGLVLNRVEFEVKEAKFDLSLFLIDTDTGLLGVFTYKTALFDAETIRRMATRFNTLLGNLVARPDDATGNIAMISATEIEEDNNARERLQTDKLSKLRAVRRKSVPTAGLGMITSAVFDQNRGYPLCVMPARDDVDLAAWAGSQRPWIEAQLRQYGAILFRGFARGHASVDLESFAAAVSDHLIDEYGDLPRDSESGRVYKSTPYPSDKAILIHNESSHLHRYPTKIFFSCIIPAASGGESPLIDCRALYHRLDPAIIESFRTRKLMYVRNYIDAVDVSWEHFFQTSDRAAVEAYCRSNDISCEWFGESGLRTSVVCDAVRKHQVTGEDVFFNQICLHHISCVDPSTRESLIKLYGANGLPRNVYYGDGEPIEDAVVDEIRRAVDELQVQFPWEKHDVIMVDNVMCAHGRNPFEGDRKIVVAIADIFDDRVGS